MPPLMGVPPPLPPPPAPPPGGGPGAAEGVGGAVYRTRLRSKTPPGPGLVGRPAGPIVPADVVVV
eukprot:16180579-Heterocapsa_arctica.AAC.1